MSRASSKIEMPAASASAGAPGEHALAALIEQLGQRLPFVALKDIAQLDRSNGANVVAIVAFYVVMFAFVEVPIVAFAFAPERTAAWSGRFNAWLGHNARRVAAYVLAAVGTYLTTRGLLQL